jgi:hypothetical protein
LGGKKFEDGAVEVLSALRKTLGRAVNAIPGAPRAADLRRVLGLDAALAWQIFSIGNAEDVIAVGRLVPKAKAMERFIRAARDAHVDEQIMADVEKSYLEFDVWVREHAETRETFAAILSALRPPETAPWTKLRRTAFRANCGVWGVSVQTSVHCAVFHERPTGELDSLSLRAQIGVRGYRAGVGVSMSAMLRTWGGSEPPPETPSANVMIDGAELLPEVCSKPLPSFERRTLPDGSTRDYLVIEGLGRESEATVWWRSFNGNFPGGSRKPPHGCSCRCSDPTETLLIDLLLPKGWSDPKTLGLRILGPDSKFVPQRRPTDLPFEGNASHLGTRLQSMYTPAAPEYAALVEKEIAARGWQQTVFDIYRCVVRYPILHSFTLMYLGVEGAEGDPAFG